MNPNFHRIMQRAISLHRDGHIDQAIVDYEAVLKHEPRHPDALQFMGVAKMQVGEVEQAVDLLRKSVAAQPKNSQAQYNLGLAMLGVGRASKALAAFRRAVAVEPKNFEARTALAGTLLEHFEQFNVAEKHLRKVIKTNPNYAPAHNNLAVLFATLGRIDEAAASAREAVRLAPRHAPALITLGSQMTELGEIVEAERLLGSAITLSPDNAAAHIGIATILLLKGSLSEAEAEFNRALELEPENTEGLRGLAAIHSRRRQYDESVALLERALATKPASPAINSFLGSVLGWKGKWSDAVARFRAAWDAEPNDANLAQAFADSLSDATGMLPDAQMWKDIERCLSFNGINHDRLSAAATRLLHNVQKVGHLQQQALEGQFSLSATDLQKGEKLSSLSTKFCISLLRRVIIQDPKLEVLFTAIRKELLALAVAGRLPEERLHARTSDFLYALAEQCFNNEYVYHRSQEEAAKAATLATQINNRLAQPEESPPRAALAVLACYQPLGDLGLSAFLAEHRLASRNDSFSRVITQQIRNATMERTLIGEMEELGDSGDGTSAKVRRQYEEFPYPRWIGVASQKPIALGGLINGFFPNTNLVGHDFAVEPDILIAGCGTGAHAIASAARIRGAHVLAIDLSLASLAYGKRKAHELGADHIQWARGDILSLAGDARRFDVIECVGVLHHMHEPTVAMRILRDLLKPGGVMKLGLYSELARSELPTMEMGSSAAGDDVRDYIREARHKILTRPEDAPLNRVLMLRDFYALSECRDLLFPAEEHRFSLPQLAHCLADLDLEFLGFEIRKRHVVDSYLTRFPDDPAAVNLDNWHQFETDNPHIFLSMYQFWVRPQEAADG